jgi:hypothetical protein
MVGGALGMDDGFKLGLAQGDDIGVDDGFVLCDTLGEGMKQLLSKSAQSIWVISQWQIIGMLRVPTWCRWYHIHLCRPAWYVPIWMRTRLGHNDKKFMNSFVSHIRQMNVKQTKKMSHYTPIAQCARCFQKFRKSFWSDCTLFKSG